MNPTQTHRFTSSAHPGELTLHLGEADLRALARLHALQDKIAAQAEGTVNVILNVPFRGNFDNDTDLLPGTPSPGVPPVLLVSSRTGLRAVLRTPEHLWTSDERPWHALLQDTGTPAEDQLDLPPSEPNAFPLAAREAFEHALLDHFPQLEDGDSGAGGYGYDLTMGDAHTGIDFNFSASQDDQGGWTYAVTARELLDDDTLDRVGQDFMRVGQDFMDDDGDVLGDFVTARPGDLIQFLSVYLGEGQAQTEPRTV